MDSKLVKERIAGLRKEKNAVILAHYYADPEVQDIADFLGDSLGLSRKAAETDADVIVFAGVRFMAETAAILCPDKQVLSPAPDAGCSLADSITAHALREWKEKNPEGTVVSYVNTTAEVKALTDICCTSANALKVIESLPADTKILFGPDRNLGGYIMKRTGRTMDLWNGCCTVHEEITPELAAAALDRYPEADILIHPEAKCSSDIPTLGNPRIFFYSTAGMLEHVRKSDRKVFVIGTETDTSYQLRKENPDRKFIPLLESARCSEMKKVTLEKVLDCLENGTGRVMLDREIRDRALVPIMRMLEL